MCHLLDFQIEKFATVGLLIAEISGYVGLICYTSYMQSGAVVASQHEGSLLDP